MERRIIQAVKRPFGVIVYHHASVSHSLSPITTTINNSSRCPTKEAVLNTENEAYIITYSNSGWNHNRAAGSIQYMGFSPITTKCGSTFSRSRVFALPPGEGGLGWSDGYSTHYVGIFLTDYPVLWAAIDERLPGHNYFSPTKTCVGIYHRSPSKRASVDYLGWHYDTQYTVLYNNLTSQSWWAQSDGDPNLSTTETRCFSPNQLHTSIF